MNTATELSPIKAQVTKLEKQATELTIATPEQNVAATELKAKLKEAGTLIKARKEEITKPLNEALKSARNLFAPLEQQFESADAIVGRKLIAYKQEVERKTREEEARIAARVERGTMKIETAEKKMENLPTVAKTTRTEHGAVQFRKIKKVQVINPDLVPDKFWVIDQVALRSAALAVGQLGEVIPGVKVYEEETV